MSPPREEAAKASLPASEAPAFARKLQPLLAEYCTGCHGNEKKKADLNLEKFKPDTRLYESRKTWEAVRDILREREMPPEKKPQPTEAERDAMIAFIDLELAKFDCTGEINPGRVTLRRLNRSEYNNTIRDLTGLDLDLAASFPSDEVGYGFDNIGDVLSLPPLLMEKYLDAAEAVATQAILADYPPKPKVVRISGNRFRPDLRNNSDHIRREGSTLGLYREGTGSHRHRFQQPGKYKLRLRAYGDQAGPEPPRLSLQLDGRELNVFPIKATSAKPQLVEWTVQIKDKNTHRLSIGYLNNYNVQNHPNRRLRGDRNLFLSWLEVEGPLDQAPPPPPESHARIIQCDPLHRYDDECARRSLRDFSSRAWRRPVSDAEVDRLLRLVHLAQSRNASFLESMQVAVQAILVSPHFLFRWELDPEKDRPAGVRELNDHELASRLSYFLWSSMPDDHLRQLADQGALKRPGILEAEVERMLDDPKASALVDNFAGQWLQIRNLDIATPDPELFPEFNDDLKQSMKRETQLFFQAIMKEDRSLMDFIDADFTYVNPALARFYGLPKVKGSGFQKVHLKPEHHRGGILTHASVLTITSNPTRTSPVNRGKWILEQILGTPPPPPPPDVPELEEEKEEDATASLRERLEMHRAKAECATCHNKMDPLGFAFENFNAIGQWRDKDGKFDIDPSGVLPGGESFQGPEELKAILRQRDTFIRSLTEKMLTFALGRGLEYYDLCAVNGIHTQLKDNEFRFRTLVRGIVTSDPFRQKSIGSGVKTASLNAP